MRFVKTTLCLAVMTAIPHAGPRYVEVTAEKPQKFINVTSSNLGEGFWAFSIDVSIGTLEIPQDIGAYLILQSDKGNLLSTVIRPSLSANVANFYAAVHLDLLQWARVEVRDNQTVYVIKLASFQRAAAQRLGLKPKGRVSMDDDGAVHRASRSRVAALIKCTAAQRSCKLTPGIARELVARGSSAM
jgi:hypothetical protein